MNPAARSLILAQRRPQLAQLELARIGREHTPRPRAVVGFYWSPDRIWSYITTTDAYIRSLGAELMRSVCPDGVSTALPTGGHAPAKGTPPAICPLAAQPMVRAWMVFIADWAQWKNNHTAWLDRQSITVANQAESYRKTANQFRAKLAAFTGVDPAVPEAEISAGLGGIPWSKLWILGVLILAIVALPPLIAAFSAARRTP